MLEDYLIKYCSPTLASLKSGSLFNCICPEDADIEKSISEWNHAFRAKGICMHLLRKTNTTALIYVYRQSALKDTLADPDIRSFLSSYGYSAYYCCDGCASVCGTAAEKVYCS